uniref:Uncharacterized protein n=1 Tax=Megaselia scalaris TaxID=36166 RepID=T1GDT3_MEGSC
MQMFSMLKDGFPELNIPAIDPFIIEKAKYQIKSDDFQIRVVLKNMVVLGSSQTNIQDVNFEKSNNLIFMKTHSEIPSMNVTGSYKAEMTVSETTSYYGGNFRVELYDIVSVHEFDAELIDDGDRKIVKLLKFDVSPTIGKMNMKAAGFDPDPTINSMLVQMANDYWQQFYKFLVPETKKYWEPIMLEISNRFLSVIAFDSVLDES